jgi:anti-anti-sigma regulatory factor
MKHENHSSVYRVAASLTIDDLPGVQEAWRDLVSASPEAITIDLQEVTEVDTAGWQLLHSLANSCIHGAIKLVLTGMRAELCEQAAQLGFGPPMVPNR